MIVSLKTGSLCHLSPFQNGHFGHSTNSNQQKLPHGISWFEGRVSSPANLRGPQKAVAILMERATIWVHRPFPMAQRWHHAYSQRWWIPCPRALKDGNCKGKSISIHVHVWNFLAELCSLGASHCTANVARSAVSAYLQKPNTESVGSHPVACRLVKGVFES